MYLRQLKQTKGALCVNIKFIVNPTSGRQMVQQNVDGVAEQLVQEGLWRNVDIFYTRARNEGYEAAFDLKEGEYDLVIAVGGDGTVHEVVNGILHGGSNIPMAIMPAGPAVCLPIFLIKYRGKQRWCWGSWPTIWPVR